MKNKIIVITGSSSGLGARLVKDLCVEYQVIGLSRNNDEFNEQLNNFKHIKTDIGNSTDVKNAFEQISNQFGKIDILINNAGIFIAKPFDECEVKEIDDIININLKGALYCTLETLKIMEKGRIINISSVSGNNAIAGQTIYSASKFGLNGFSDALGQEVQNKNINITTICPGGMDTPLWNEKNPYGGKGKILNTKEVCELIQYIIKLPSHIVLKKITLFPKNEWH